MQTMQKMQVGKYQLRKILEIAYYKINRNNSGDLNREHSISFIQIKHNHDFKKNICNFSFQNYNPINKHSFEPFFKPLLNWIIFEEQQMFFDKLSLCATLSGRLC